ncbi:MAG: hypothetical protein PHW96_01540 [Candidatus Nanoarchaeia archaeon]|nr:hypothetical protein [Candidatus Nanoarchaeia archaeon]
MEIIMQIISAFVSITGLVLGGFVSKIAFGTSKSMFIDTILYIISMIILSSMEFDSFFISVFVYFITGFFIIISIRAVTTSFGFVSNMINEKKEVKINESIILNLIKNLKRKNFKKKDIEEILVKSGFKEKEVKNIGDGFYKIKN